MEQNTEPRNKPMHMWSINLQKRDFPGGAVVRNLPANAGDTGSSPGLGGSHMPRSNSPCAMTTETAL